MRRSLMTLVAASFSFACGGGGQVESTTVDTGISNTGISAGTTSDSDSDSNTTTASTTLHFDMSATDSDTATSSADDSGGDDCGPQMVPDTDAVLTGTVYAPNLQLPISGALVYVTDGQVEPVPDGVYCATCVDLGCLTPFTFTQPDGSFTLETYSGAGQKLVVQKGQFLRVTSLDVSPGAAAVAPSMSNLPGDWNPGGGKYIPRIAVYDTSPDKVPNVLAKFGMGQVDGGGNLMPGTNRFTLIDDSDQGAFLDNLSEMMKYHIIFLPCASTKYWAGAPAISASRLQNLRSYVEAGGKLYATDHSNEYIKDPFPNYQDFYNPGMPDIQPAYSSQSTVVDQDMLAWLQALPPALKDIGGGNPTLNSLPTITTQLNYSGIEATYDVIVQDDMGQDVNVGHHTWVEGPCQSCSADPGRVRPMAITGQYGCGRMMYSTFENSSTAHAGLNPQELVLLYMILEIGVCFSEVPPPPPPIE